MLAHKVTLLSDICKEPEDLPNTADEDLRDAHNYVLILFHLVQQEMEMRGLLPGVAPQDRR
jgi:hypothetical protein